MKTRFETEADGNSSSGSSHLPLTYYDAFSCQQGKDEKGFRPKLLIPSFSSKRRHVTEKHVLTGSKRDMLGNQTFEVLRPLSKLFEFVDTCMFLINKCRRNFKPDIPLSEDFRNEGIQMAATQPISEICERYCINRPF